MGSHVESYVFQYHTNVQFFFVVFSCRTTSNVHHDVLWFSVSLMVLVTYLEDRKKRVDSESLLFFKIERRVKELQLVLSFVWPHDVLPAQ